MPETSVSKTVIFNPRHECKLRTDTRGSVVELYRITRRLSRIGGRHVGQVGHRISLPIEGPATCFLPPGHFFCGPRSPTLNEKRLREAPLPSRTSLARTLGCKMGVEVADTRTTRAVVPSFLFLPFESLSPRTCSLLLQLSLSNVNRTLL